MISYAQIEFEQENVELLVPNVLDGVEAYRNAHRIKDARYDAQIALPYRQSELLCQQIANLQTEVSGLSFKEKRKSKAIQRDIWSALKYALWMAKKLETGLKTEIYRTKSSWSDKIEAVRRMGGFSGTRQPSIQSQGGRAGVLAMRKNVR